jgi:site-specific DNA-cytosine methylase
MDILTNISLFSGAGGLDLGARLVGGFRTVGYVERDRYAQGGLRDWVYDPAMAKMKIRAHGLMDEAQDRP